MTESRGGLVEAAQSVAAGSTVGAPDAANRFGELSALDARCQARAVATSDHLRTAVRFWMQTTAWSEEGEVLPAPECDGDRSEKVHAALQACTEAERTANIRAAAAQQCLAACREQQSRESELELPEAWMQRTWEEAVRRESKRASPRRARLTTVQHARQVRAMLGDGGNAGADGVADGIGIASTAAPLHICGDEATAAAAVVASSAHGHLDDDRATTRCPITGAEMHEPVRNTRCLHTYERTAIEQLLRSHHRLRPRTPLTDGHAAPCPVAGCRASVSVATLEPDTEAALALEWQRRRQARRAAR